MEKITLPKLKFYIIDDKYVEYLKKFDIKIPDNKGQSRTFVGVVLIYNNHNYFAPLSSPKVKHIKLSNKALDIFKIDNGKLGVVNINNMFPVPKNSLTELFSAITDKKYRLLAENQLNYLNKNRLRLYIKVRKFHELFLKNKLNISVMLRTCNFDILEDACDNYKM